MNSKMGLGGMLLLREKMMKLVKLEGLFITSILLCKREREGVLGEEELKCSGGV